MSSVHYIESYTKKGYYHKRINMVIQYVFYLLIYFTILLTNRYLAIVPNCNWSVGCHFFSKYLHTGNFKTNCFGIGFNFNI